MNLKELVVREASLEDASFFIPKWHYSGIVPAGMNIFFGVEHGEMADLFSQEFYAMAAYGLSSSPEIHNSLARKTGRPVTQSNMLELRRLCRREPKDDIPLTWFIAKCHRLLKKRGYRFVVSFSDPDHGHNGGIYRAANFTHLGMTNKETQYKDPDGLFVHRKVVTNRAAERFVTVREVVLQDGLVPFTTQPKDRWFIEIR